MKARLSLATLTAMSVLSGAPAAIACPSIHGVKAYHGHATVDFTAQASGQDSANGGTYAASLERNLSHVQLNLTRKKVTRLGAVIFTGKASGGGITVNDTFEDTGTMWHGKEQAGGSLKSQLPDYGSATLYLYPKPCKHQLVVLFGARTAFTGNVPGADPHPTVTGSAFGAEEPITKSLKLSGDTDPDAYWGGRCPRKEFAQGVFSCYGFTSGEIGLCSTSDVGASNCGGPSDERMKTGSRKFSWRLTPTFS